MQKLQYTEQNHNEHNSCAALVVLQTDEVVESEVRAWLPESIKLYHTRIQNAADVNEHTLLDMREKITAVCRLLPEHAPIQVVAYCCTSGTTVIGEDTVERNIQVVYPNARVTNPLSAVKAKLHDLGATKIGVLTPYIPAVTNAMTTHLNDTGFDIVSTASFYEQHDYKVCRISNDSIIAAIKTIASNSSCDAIFASCTNLRTQSFLDTLSEELNLPVISSNSALAWHIEHLASS